MLGLTEELFLLTLIEKKKSITISASPALPYALAGAILLELTFSGKIKLEDGKRVCLVDYTLTGVDYLDESLDAILTTNRAKRISYWIDTIGLKGRKIRRSLVKLLVAQGVLQEEEKNYLWVIPYKEVSQVDGSAKYQLKNCLRNVVMGGETPDARAVALLSLLRTCSMLNHIFTSDEIKAASKKVEEIVQNEVVGQAVIETLQSIEAATAAALAASSISV
jgi:golgi phosphoprotein 3